MGFTCNKGALCLLLGMGCTFLGAAQFEVPQPNLTEVRLVPLDPTPEPEEVETTVIFPKNGQLKMTTPITVQLRLEGYPIGTDSDFPRKEEVFNDPDGQSLRVYIDNYPYVALYEDLTDSLDNNEIYYEESLDFDIPFNIGPGMHVIRSFPVRSFGESLKGDKSFTASTFYYKDKSNPNGYELNGPYLTYNQPVGKYKYKAGAPLLFDFYLTNCRLSTDGFKVKITIDGAIQRVINQWIPYYLYGLSKGKHTIRLQLLDRDNKQVPGPFNDVEETILLE